jgi:ubiquinone/menaquinone biosynthesis C-methylase UbiE
MSAAPPPSMGVAPHDLARLYRRRFDAAAVEAKDRVWKVLCHDFFQRFVRESDTMLDLACGYGEFSRHVRAARKIAVDLNPDAALHLPADVEFHQARADALPFLADASIDVAFTSNFFEHLPDKATLDRVLAEVLRALRPGGRFVALQPNIRVLADKYWDFYDHLLPLSHLSCREAFEKAGYEVETLIDRFLPYTTRSRMPQHPALVRVYLRVPLAWRLLGKQFLIVGAKRS